MRAKLRIGRSAFFAAVMLCGFLASHVWICNTAHAQITIRSVRDSPQYLILPGPPREIRRSLSAAERSIANREYSDGVEALTELLDTPDLEDFFLPPDANGLRVSLKRRALDLLGSMPAAGREMYELEVGAEARQMLTTALQSGNISGVREVSRRFFHTKTGYQATMLLARSELDQGRPIAAVLHLQRLINSPSAAAAFDHELPFLLAACWHLAGDPAAVDRVVSEHMASLAGAKVVLGGVEETIPTQATAMGDWLAKVLGAQISFRASTGEDWTLARGNANRNGFVDGGLALAKLEWKMEPGSALAPTDVAVIQDIQTNLRDDSNSVISSLMPLAVGDQLLFRTARRMYGGVISEGRLVWEGPNDEQFDEAAEETIDPKRRSVAADARRTFLTKRMCQDAAYGQMSSDGQRLFLIKGNRAAQAVQNVRNRWGAVSGPRMANELVAVELASEGKMLWTTTDSWDPSVFFLGTPLPIEDELFAIAEIKDEIKLVSINPLNGELLWAQQLAQVEAPFGNTLDNTRRLAGAAPSFANGIMVCTTSSGAVVAVDIASRVLLWASTYDTSQPRSRTQIFGSRPTNNSARKPNDQWAESFAVVEQGIVVVTPVEANKLLCLDLLTGEPRWPAKDRKDMLFVGGIHNSVLIMIEKNRIRGLDLATGEDKWKPVELENDAFTSGRGFVSNGHYYLPVANGDNSATGALVRTRFSDGKTDYHRTERVLGNLICHGDHMISQGLDGIFGYALRNRKRDSVREAMKNDTATPDVLEDYANILASDGKREEAIQVMRKACEQETDALNQQVLQSHLLRMITNSLQMDFAKHQELVEEAKSLATEPEEQQRLDDVVAVGLISIGNYDQALAAHLQLIESGSAMTDDVSMHASRLRAVNRESQWRVSESINLSNHIQEILEQSSDRDAALDTVREAIANVQASQDATRMRRWLKVLGNMESLEWECDAVRLALAQRLLANPSSPPSDFQFACNLLARVARSQSQDDSLAQMATARLAKAYEEDHPQRAIATYEKLIERWGNDATGDGDSATTPQARLKAYQAELADNRSAPAPWRHGRLKIKRNNSINGLGSTFGQLSEVRLVSQSEDWPTGGKVFINSQPAEIIIVDGSGQTIRRCDMGQFNALAAQYATAKQHGHVLVVSLGDRLIAIDMLSKSDEPMWTHQLTSQAFGRTVNPSRKPINVPFVESRAAAWSSTGAPYGEMGGIGDDGVCVMRGTELQCVDLQTGQTRWAVRDVGGKVSLFGDTESCYVSRDANGETRVFQLRTGKETERVKIPSTNHWATFGRYLLHYEGMYNHGRDLSISLYDCREEKVVWKQEVAAHSKARIVNNEELVLLHPDGKLTIRRILDGELLLDTQVKPEKDLIGIFVWRSDDQYLMVTNHSDVTRTSRQRKENIVVIAPSTHMMTTPLVCGHVYAFNRQTKKLDWDPVPMEQYGVPSAQPPNCPLLVALRQITRTKIDAKLRQNRKITNKCEVAFLDRRTGLITSIASPDRIQRATPRVVAQQDTQSVRIELPPINDIVATFVDSDEAATDRTSADVHQPKHQSFLPVPFKEPGSTKETEGKTEIDETDALDLEP